MPVSVMIGNPVQQGNRVMITVGQDVILRGFQFRIRIVPGAITGLLLIALLAAEEGGEGIKAETEIPEGILLLTAALLIITVAVAALAAGTAPGAAEGIAVISGSSGGRADDVRINGAFGPGGERAGKSGDNGRRN